MCGRYSMFAEEVVLVERFQVALPAASVQATYNAAPTQAQRTILHAEPHAMTVSTWGFVPAWAADRNDVKPVINARADTVATKPFFRDAFKARRCLVLADGFYEWRRMTGGKVPYRIAFATEEPFAFAGIWSPAHTGAGRPESTFAIITTEANDLVATIHNRMPVILHARDEEDWLNPQLSLEAAQALLVPFPAERMTAYQVSSQVNSPAFNTPEAVRPVEDAKA